MQLVSQAGAQEAGQRWEGLSWLQKKAGLQDQGVETEGETHKDGGTQPCSRLQ